MSKKYKDLQPWLDYFDMLAKHVSAGLLEVNPTRHEAYITQPALHALTPGDNPSMQLASGSIATTARHLRTYAAWLSQEGKQYEHQPFAVIVVQHDKPNDLLYIICLTQKRNWLGRTREHLEIISCGNSEYNAKALKT